MIQGWDDNNIVRLTFVRNGKLVDVTEWYVDDVSASVVSGFAAWIARFSDCQLFVTIGREYSQHDTGVWQ